MVNLMPLLPETNKGRESRDASTEIGGSQYARSLIESSLDPLVTISADGKITDVNEATVKVTGVSRERLIGTDFADYFTEPQKAREGYQQVFSKGFVTDYPLTIRHKEGRLTDVLYNATVYKDARGTVLGIFAAARDVTAQKQASQYARSLIEASLDPLVTISPDGKITDVNQATELVTGFPRAKLVGTDFSEYFTEPEKAREGYKRVFSVGSVTDYPLAIRHASGRVTDVLYNATVYKDTQGRVQGVFAAARDITQQKKTGEERSRLAAIVDSSADAIVGKSLDGIITSWNKGAERMFNYTAAEILGKHVSVLIPPDLREEEQRILSKLGRGERIEPYETLRVRKGGETFEVSLTVSPVRDAEGKIVGASKIARDITAQKRAAQYARSLIESSLDPLVTISAGGKITDVNEATVRITGVSRDDLLGTDFASYFTEPQKAREGYQQVFSKGFVTDYPLTIRNKDARLMDVLYNATVYKDARGTVLGIFAAARDVTAQKQASQYARSLIEASLDPLVTISADGKITDVNEATVRITGVSREQLIGTDFADYFTEPQKAREGYQQVFSKGFVTDYPLTIRHKEGRVTDVLYNATVYKDARGTVLGVFAAARDVTAQRQAELALADQRNRELVRLAELEKFQRLTVGRELKMIELKRELEGLRKELEAGKRAPVEGR